MRWAVVLLATVCALWMFGAGGELTSGLETDNYHIEYQWRGQPQTLTKQHATGHKEVMTRHDGKRFLCFIPNTESQKNDGSGEKQEEESAENLLAPLSQNCLYRVRTDLIMMMECRVQHLLMVFLGAQVGGMVDVRGLLRQDRVSVPSGRRHPRR